MYGTDVFTTIYRTELQLEVGDCNKDPGYRSVRKINAIRSHFTELEGPRAEFFGFGAEGLGTYCLKMSSGSSCYQNHRLGVEVVSKIYLSKLPSESHAQLPYEHSFRILRPYVNP